MRHTARRLRSWFLSTALLGAAAPLWAGAIYVKTSTGTAPASVYAESQDDRVMVDLLRVSTVLGSTVTLRDGEYVIAYASGAAVVNPQGYFRVQPKGERKWQASGLSGVPYFSGSRFLVALEDIPPIFHRPFVYHLQRRELKEVVPEAQDPTLNPAQRRITVRHVRKGAKDWVSVEDVARELGVVVYASQAGQYTLVMPDFTFLDLKVGEAWVYKKKQIYKPLPDPIQSLSGVPHATPSALSTLLEAEIQWDAGAGALRVPRYYGRARLAQDKVDDGLLKYTGYRPRPLTFDVDEVSAYFQTPGPTYATLPADVYESVRDFATNGVLDPGTSGYDQWSGEARLQLTGSAWKQPLDGGVRLERVGTRARVSDGALEWGFPQLKVRGGREFTQMGDLDQQLETMDQVSVSHSNDRFAEGKVPFEWKVGGSYGKTQFFSFLSNELISQAIVFRQRVYVAGVDAFWRINDLHRANFSINRYRFLNHEKEITTEVNFLDDVGVDDDITISTQAKALTASILTDRHDVTVVEAGYGVEERFQLSATEARSEYKDLSGARLQDDSWRLGAVLGTSRRKVTVSHQRTGNLYRSIGDPLNYQGRNITNVTPYWEFTKVWRASAYFRREDGKEAVIDALLPYRNDYVYVNNSLSFRRFNLRHRVTHYDYTHSFSLWGSNLDSTVYFGRDSLEAGVGWAQQRTGEPLFGVPPKGTVFKQAYSARGGYQILRPDWKLSLSQDAARNHYPRYNFQGVRSGTLNKWETTTQILGQRKAWEGMLQYGRKPRYYSRPDYLYTTTLRAGWQPSDRKIINVYYAASSQRRGLGHPEVWRMGLEFTNDFY